MLAKMTRLLSSIPRGMLIEIFLGGMCLEVLALGLPLFTQVLFDKVIVHSSYSTLHVVAIGMVIVFVFESSLVYLYSRHVHFLAARIDDSLMKPSIDHLTDLPLSYFESRSKGEIASHLREIGEIRQFLAVGSITAIIDIVFMAVILALMALYSMPLALITAACVPVLGVLSIILRPSVRGQYRELTIRQGKFESVLSEGLASIQTIKTSALEHAWKAKLNTAHDRFVASTLQAKRSAAVEETVLRVVQRAVILAVLWIGASSVLVGDLSFGQLIASYMFALRVLGPSGRLFQVWLGLQQLQQTMRNLDALLGTPPEQKKGILLMPPPRGGGIAFSGVNFRYPSASKDVLQDVSIQFPPASFVGVLGHSGSGKSTLAKLAQRHIVPTAGHVTLGGADISMIDIPTLRNHIKLITQDSGLFQDTVINNLRVGDDALTLSDVVLACEATLALDFVEGLPDGFNTMLDEKAAQLSSGQRQRLALARAILQRPEVLILDEATNALDNKTELEVLRNLREYCPHSTLIVITHRASTVRHADQIFVVGGGQAQPQSKPYPPELFNSHQPPELHVA